MDGTFADRWEAARERVAAACARAGRASDSVRIVAVSKTYGPEQVCEAADAGAVLFGESRVQEAAQKQPLCPGHLEWHFVGHLQTNKAKLAVRLFRMVHSADSWRLLESLETACEAAGVNLPVCLEVNVSGESSKFGFKPEDVPDTLARCGTLRHVEVVGLMTVPPVTREPEGARPHFRRLRELRDVWRDRTGFALDELSMGMSADFEVAVEEGATLVRLGTMLFGARAPAAKAVSDDRWEG